MKPKNIVLKISILRIILAFVVMVALIYHRNKTAIGIFAITAFISFADTYITKRRHKKSLLKSIADFFADRLLVDIATLILAIKDVLPFWVFAIFLARDFFTIVIGAVLGDRGSRRGFLPTALGRISLLFQIVMVLTLMISQINDFEVDYALIWVTVIVTAASGIESLFKSEFRLIKRRADAEKFRLFSNIKFADTFTFLNVIFGLLAIVFAIRGWHTTASIMMVLSVVSDYFDGKMAKAMQQSNDFGKELDSLGDTVSFGVAPAVFGFSLIQTPLAAVSFTIFLFCGILRLARYNITNLKGEFQGMPITTNGIIIPIIYFLDVSKIVYPYAYLILSALMVSSFKLKRLP